WIKQFDQDLRDLEFDFVRHDPIAYIIPCVIPPEIQEGLLSIESAILYNKVRSAITGDPTISMMENLPGDKLPPATWWKELKQRIQLGEQKGEVLGKTNLDHFDWEAARKRVRHVLERFTLHRDEQGASHAGEYYMNYWKVGLKKLLGWSDKQILEWAKQY